MSPRASRYGRGIRCFLRRHGVLASPLRRRTDRVEGALLVGTALGVCVVFGVGFLVGTARYEAAASAAITAGKKLHRVDAILREPTSSYSLDGGAGQPLGRKAVATATWRTLGGQPRTGKIEAPAAREMGATIRIWTDARGQWVTGPPTESELTIDAIGTGAGIGFGGAAALLVLSAVGRWRLDRARAGEWEHEWEKAQPH